MNNSTQTKSTTKVGFIGLGDQGGPMAQAVSQAGYSLHVWARRKISLEILTGYEYTSHQSPQELGSACDIILLCLTDDADIWDLINTKNLVASLKKGAIVVNHGTGDPSENLLIGNYLQSKGFRFLDAPVSGGRPGAIARTLTTIVGGDGEAFESCKDLFAAFSAKTVHLGKVGSGQRGKLLNNALTFMNLRSAVEVLELARVLGLNVRSIQEMLSVSSGGSTILRFMGGMNVETAAHLQGLMRKDILHFVDANKHLDVPTQTIYQWANSGVERLVDTIQVLSNE